uniref:Uncharacterized protein n=1 Tax=Sphaerodactylus townsendi TaxID=933632 RepID=A0ACB8F854_9SAUR
MESYFTDSPFLSAVPVPHPTLSDNMNLLSGGRKRNICWQQEGKGQEAMFHQQSSVCFLMDSNHRTVPHGLSAVVGFNGIGRWTFFLFPYSIIVHGLYLLGFSPSFS